MADYIAMDFLNISGLTPLIVNSVYDNIIYDGGFEKWTAGVLDQWTLSGANPPTVTQCGDALGDTTKRSGAYCAKLNRNAGGDGYIYQSISNYLEFAGREVAFSCYVKCATASRVRLSINDGTSNAGSANAASADWQKLTVTATIQAVPTKLEFRIDCINADVDIYVDEAMATPCSTAPTFIPPGAAYRQTAVSGVASINITGGTALTGAVLFTNTASDITVTQNVATNKMLIAFSGTSNFLTATSAVTRIQDASNKYWAFANSNQFTIGVGGTNAMLADANGLTLYRTDNSKALLYGTLDETTLYTGTNANNVIVANATSTKVYSYGTEGISLDTAGNVTMTNKSGVAGYYNTNLNFTDSAWTTVPFNTSEFDVRSELSASLFTAKQAGKYLVSGQALINGKAATGQGNISIYKNGALYNNTFMPFITIYSQPAIQKCFDLATGNTIEFRVWQNSTTSAILTGGTGNTYFSIVKVA